MRGIDIGALAQDLASFVAVILFLGAFGLVADLVVSAHNFVPGV